MTNKKQHGGRREGAGRPKSLKNPQRITIWLEAQQIEWLKGQGEIGEVIRAIIRQRSTKR